MYLIDPFIFKESKCYNINVIDGDTFKCNVILTEDIHIKQTIRISGIDAPEKSTLRGLKLKMIICKIFEDSDVFVEGIGKDVYGRTLGIVRLDIKHNYDSYCTNTIIKTKIIERTEEMTAAESLLNSKQIDLSVWMLENNFALPANKRVKRNMEQEDEENISISDAYTKLIDDSVLSLIERN